MGILAKFIQNALSQGPAGAPPNPLGGGGPSPPNPFGGGSPIGQPGGWPLGVPNPFGVPSPGNAWNTVSGWFTNPYGTSGSQPNPSPLNGINPYGTQISGGSPPGPTPWNSPTYRPPDPNELPSGWTFGNYNMGYQNPGMSVRPPNPSGTGDVAGPYAQQQAAAGVPGWRAPPEMKEAPPPQETGGHMGGGFGTAGPWGQQWLYQTNNRGPWQHVSMGSPYYGK